MHFVSGFKELVGGDGKENINTGYMDRDISDVQMCRIVFLDF